MYTKRFYVLCFADRKPPIAIRLLPARLYRANQEIFYWEDHL